VTYVGPVNLTPMGAIDGGAITRVVVGGVVAVALALASDRAPQRVADAWRLMRTPAGDEVSRELVPGAVHGVSSEALLLASQTIPAGARIAVVVGDAPPLDPNVGAAARSFMCDWLLPRRCVSTPADADWVITYHAPSEGLPVHGTEVGLGPDANAVRVSR
jgi:hypothetical protein